MPSEKETIHFIIPCYRAAETLEATLCSIFNLNYPKDQIQVSVVENGPQEKILKTLLEKYPQVSYFFIKQKSRSLARNHPVSKSRGAFIAFVDADVVLDKDWALYCFQAINYNNVSAVGGSIYREGDSFIDDIRRRISNLSCLNSNTLESLGGMVTLNTAAMLIKKDCLDKIGLFDTTLKRYEDSDLTFRLFLAGLHIASVPRAKSYVVMSSKWFFYLFLRPLEIGYDQSKSLVKYPFHQGSVFRNLRHVGQGLFSEAKIFKRQFFRKRLKSFFVDLIVLNIRLLMLVGNFIGALRFRSQKRRVERPRPHITKVLSWDGKIYFLNPRLTVCFRANDTLFLDKENGTAFFFQGQLSEVFRNIIHHNSINEQEKEFRKSFEENGILIHLFRPNQEMHAREQGVGKENISSTLSR